MEILVELNKISPVSLHHEGSVITVQLYFITRPFRHLSSQMLSNLKNQFIHPNSIPIILLVSSVA